MEKTKRTSNKYKGKKQPKKPFKSKDFEKDVPGKNDISWYGDKILVDAAGRHNFTNPLGRPIDWSINNSGTAQITLPTNVLQGAESVPGVMSINVESGIGMSADPTSPANIFVRNFYSYIRHQNSGHANYDSPDLGIYIMAIDQIHTILEHLVRIYGVARTYSSANRYLPTAILWACGVDPYSATVPLYPNLATFRSELLNLMVKAGTLLVPRDAKFIERHKQLMQFVYSDGDTSKSQTYVFRPQGYKVYVESGAGHTGGYLEYHDMTGIHTWADWLGAASSMIDAVVQSEDMNIMSGDILKAYGRENCYQFAAFAEDYTVVPSYVPVMLLQIHNMVPAGAPFTTADFDIYQDPNLNCIMYQPIFGSNVPYQSISPIVDMPVEVPSPEDVMEATRLTHTGSVGYEASGTLKYKYVPDSLGSDVVTYTTIFDFMTDANGDWILRGHTCYGAVHDNVPDDVRILCQLSAFNWHFGMKVLHQVDNTHWQLMGYLGEMENYTPFYSYDLRKLHDAALIGEFSVPLMGVIGFKGEVK